MRGNVNCKFNDKGNGCKHPKVEKTIFGLGKRRCVKYENHRAECLHYNPYPKPDPPQPPPQKKKRMEIEEGVCPECGELLVYNGAFEMVDDEQIYYPVKCVNCGKSGKEWHKVMFTGQEMAKM